MLSLAIVDARIWSPDLLLEYLYSQMLENKSSVIDFTPEATCLQSAGVYDILDKFCNATGYSKSNITIRTSNLIESHTEYHIERDVGGWYEIPLIQEWAKVNTIEYKKNPTYHFANFISRTHWSRLWIATILYNSYKDKTLQTYNYFGTVENYNIDHYVGLDDLVRHNCKLVDGAVTFLKQCPMSLEVDTYPIQHPTNMNLMKYYPDIFLDVVVETNVTGNSFLVTEKLWRAVVARRPFIVMSNRNYLANLKKLGFKTFDQWWDETYDELAEEHRIHKIGAILEQISQWTLPELNEKLVAMDEILSYNYNNFMKLTPNQINKVFNESVSTC